MPLIMRNDLIVPYRIGEKVKIYLSEKVGQVLYTTGIITKLGEKPIIEYKDLSDLPLGSFNRLVKENEVEMPVKYKTHTKRWKS